MRDKTTFLRAAEIIGGADALIIAAGAGIGVDSGLPDFRSNNGFWNTYPALAAAQMDFTEVASPRTFEMDPELAWGFYGHRLKLYRDTVPHEGFAIMKEWGETVPLGAWVYTSNVDGAFQKAGFSEEQVHECHGSIHWMQCMNDCQSGLWPADDFKPDVDAEKCRLLNALPTCPNCRGLARPNIVMFGDWNWNHARREKQRRKEALWLETIASSGGNVAIVELGAGSAIPSVRQFSHRMSQEYGGRIVRINPREFEVPSTRDVGIPKGSLEALKGIRAAMKKSRASSDSKSEPSMPPNRCNLSPLVSAAEMNILKEKTLASDADALSNGGQGMFSFRLDAGPLNRLIDDASKGRRVYELMSIRRPADLYHYLWVEIPEAPTGLSIYVRESFKNHSRFRDPLGDVCAVSLAEFDSYFRFAGEDTDDYYYRWLSFRDCATWHQMLAPFLDVVHTSQAEIRKHDDFLLTNELSAIECCSHHCDFLPKIIRDGRRVDATEWGKEVPQDLHSLIMKLAVRSNVNSVSCPYIDTDLWRSLISEQVRRAKQQNADPQRTYELNGPDGGIPYVNDGYGRMDVEWGGYVHVPYEGACGGDLFIQPDWFQLDLNTARTTTSFNEAVFGPWGRVGSKSCKYFVTHVLALGAIPSATHQIVGPWAVYWALDAEPPFKKTSQDNSETPC